MSSKFVGITAVALFRAERSRNPCRVEKHDEDSAYAPVSGAWLLCDAALLFLPCETPPPILHGWKAELRASIGHAGSVIRNSTYADHRASRTVSGLLMIVFCRHAPRIAQGRSENGQPLSFDRTSERFSSEVQLNHQSILAARC